MKRLVDPYLAEWKASPYRKPLLLRGARQVGKTHAVQELGKQYENFVEVNFESDQPEVKTVFDRDLDPVRIIRDISFILKKDIVPGKTLLFFDEIQGVPKALTALRYFYEKLPEQHIIAAGSLLDFTTQEIGIPVGRVSSLYMYPVSFFEFLCACGYELVAQELLTHDIKEPISEPVHKKLLTILGEYLAIGGMPEAVALWCATKNKDPRPCFDVHQALIDTYRQDFNKYATKFQIKYLNVLFNAVPRQLGTKFKYSSIEGDYRKRELAPCLDLLTTAGVVHPVYRSAGNGVPLGAVLRQAQHERKTASNVKILPLDVALAQTMLGLDLTTWFLQPEQEFINKGALVETFVGQELLAYTQPKQNANLFYWRRNEKGSEAEVDYLMQDKAHVVPVEVKSGTGTSIKSMRMFLDGHKQSPYGLRLSTNNYSQHDNIRSYPLYAIAHVMLASQAQSIKYYQALL